MNFRSSVSLFLSTPEVSLEICPGFAPGGEIIPLDDGIGENICTH